MYANLRERLVIANAKLEAANSELAELKRWETGLRGGLVEAGLLKQLQLEKESADAQALKDKVLPYFGDAIKSLAEMSQKEARLKGDESIANYSELPPNVSAEAKSGRRFKTNAAEIRFDKDDRWNFKVQFVEDLTPDYEAQMNVTCRGGILFLRSEGYLVETRLEIFNGPTFGHDGAVGNAAKKNINDSLEKLMASELNAVEGVK
jgi:hypothetical protein